MDGPHVEEVIMTKLIDCYNRMPMRNHYTVAFICAAVVPVGRLFKTDLKSIPTILDTFCALVDWTGYYHLSLLLMKFTLERSGCPPEVLRKLCDACSEAGFQVYPEQNICILENEPFFKRLQFHMMLVKIRLALTEDEIHQMIHLGSAVLKRNCSEDSLLVHFLRLLQGDVIGPSNVSKLKKWLETLQRPDVIGIIDGKDIIGVRMRKTEPHPVEADKVTKRPGAAEEVEQTNLVRCSVRRMELHLVEADHPRKNTDVQGTATRDGHLDKVMKDQGVQTDQQSTIVRKPLLKELVKVKVNNWYNLGLQLDIEDNELKTIESNRPHDQEGCKRDMFRAWLQRCPQASYKQLVQVLVECKDLTEADRLCNKYGIDMPQSRSQ